MTFSCIILDRCYETSGFMVIFKRDVRTFFTNFYGIGFRTVYLFLQIFLFANILGRVISPSSIGGLSYLQYFTLGATIASLFWASFSITYDILVDKETGFFIYLITLPISRFEIVAGRILSGVVRGIFTMLPIYCLGLLYVPSNVDGVLASIAILLIFSFGLCGSNIILATTIKDEGKMRLSIRLMDLIMTRASSIMYPVAAMPLWLKMLASLNPLTYVADSFRQAIILSPYAIPPQNIVIILFFAIAMGVIGEQIYSKRIEGGFTD